MLNYLRGTVFGKQERYIILLVNDSVGYRVYMPQATLEQLRQGSELALYTYTHVREETIELYGFPTTDELDFFEQLIGISGIGPKLALGVLSVAPLDEVKKAIIHGDPSLLQKVSSVGKKTAERIIVELREKVTVGTTRADGEVSISESIQLMEALASLGYKDSEIRQALKLIPSDKKDLSEKIKEALRILSNTR